MTKTDKLMTAEERTSLIVANIKNTDLATKVGVIALQMIIQAERNAWRKGADSVVGYLGGVLQMHKDYTPSNHDEKLVTEISIGALEGLIENITKNLREQNNE